MENLIPKETKLGVIYEQQRNISQEFKRATLQHQLAFADISTCKDISWGSFQGGCEVYHGFFPTAEIFNVVSSPRHHPELFLDTLNGVVKKDDPQIWIPASATSRTYDMFRFVKPNSTILQTDLCATPVVAIALSYFRDRQLGLYRGQQLDVLKAKYTNEFDVVGTDAFLTRFSEEEKQEVLKIIYRSLKKGGVFLTTIRIPKADEIIGGQKAEKETAESLEFVDKVVNSYSTLAAKCEQKDLPYHNEKDLKSDAEKYKESMRSSHAREYLDWIADAWMPQLSAVPNMGSAGFQFTQAGFEQVSIMVSKEVYDVTSRKYLQIAAIK